MAGRIPFDRAIVDGVVGGKTIMEGSNEFLKEIIRKIWISLARS
jgi:hypothetical protein